MSIFLSGNNVASQPFISKKLDNTKVSTTPAKPKAVEVEYGEESEDEEGGESPEFEIDYSKIHEYSPKKKIYLGELSQEYIEVQPERVEPKKISKNEKYEITHNYDKSGQSPKLPKKQKQNLEKLVTEKEVF